MRGGGSNEGSAPAGVTRPNDRVMVENRAGKNVWLELYSKHLGVRHVSMPPKSQTATALEGTSKHNLQLLRAAALGKFPESTL